MAEQQVAAPEELRIDGSEAADSAIRQGGLDAAGGAGARYKLMSPSKLPISRSACLTIPPGLSPTSFLESPVLLSNIKAEPSPTTGSLFKPQPVHASVGSSSFSASQMFPHTFEEKSTDFEFRPSGSITAPAESNQQREVQFQGQCHGFSFTPALVSGVSVSASESDGPATLQAPDSDEVNHTSQNDHRGTTPVLADDGYNWRKYGQKQVKGSEFPRSYYKCTHPNCEVKKLFERSHDGQITEIIYKGTHDHPKPQPNRRNSPGTVMPSQEERSGLVPFTGQDDGGSNIYNYMSHRMEQNGNPEVTANDDSEEVAASNRNNDDMDDDDPYSKRRKMDCGMEVTPLVKPIREPRVVVQTLSEVDILDDGYRWRKYGQKVVRGNPNPRSYYKCTAVGCPVRKHVERASHDPKAVITTYEGKHNHDVPTAKSNSHSMSGNGAPRLRPDDNDQISLDLGVGRNSSNENTSNEQQQQQHSQFLHTQVSGSNFRFVQATPIAQYYNVLNTGMTPYGSRENPAQAPTDDLSSLNHASYPYPQSIGRIQSGP